VAGLRGDPPAVGALVETFDLPHVGLHTGTLQGGDRSQHEAGPDLTVIAGAVPVDRVELRGAGRYEEFEEELSPVLMQPVRQATKTQRLPLVETAVAVRIVADEDLRERGIELLDVRAEIAAILEVELVAPAHFGGHGEQDSELLGSPRHRGAELLVDENAGAVPESSCRQRFEEPLEDQRLGVRDSFRLRACRGSRDAEELLLKRAPVVEREHVEIALIA
jgi:hypothetical protein